MEKICVLARGAEHTTINNEEKGIIISTISTEKETAKA